MQTTSTYIYPEHDLPEKKKDRLWHLNYCKAIYGNFTALTPRQWLYNANPHYALLRRYAIGDQPIDKYREALDCVDNNDESINSIDWGILPIIPKFIEIIVQKIKAQGIGFALNRIDSIGVNQKKSVKANMQADVTMRNLYEEISAIVGKDLGQVPAEELPVDMDEVEAYMNYDYKDLIAMQMEKAVAWELNNYYYEEQRERALLDRVIVGIGGHKVGCDNTGRPTIRYVKPENLIVSYVLQKDFSDLVHVGERRWVTKDELIKEMGKAYDDLNEEDLKAIENLFGYKRFAELIPPNTNRHMNSVVEQRAEVLDCEWLSTTKAENGEHYRVRHKACWIPSTEIIWNWGLSNDMVRFAENPTETRLSYVLYAPTMLDGNVMSICEKIIPLADLMQITYLRMQQAIAQMNPNQMAIDVDALMSLNIDWGGGTDISPMQIIDLLMKRGILLFSGTGLAKNNPNAKPIYDIPARSHEIVRAFYDLFSGFKEMMKELIGINDATDASTPSSDTLVGVQQQMVAATNTALGNLYDSDASTMKRVVMETAERIVDYVRYYNKEFRYKEFLGEQTVEFIRENIDAPIPAFGIEVVKAYNEAEKQKLAPYIQTAITNGEIDVEQLIDIDNCKTLKEAQHKLKISRRRKIRQMQAMEQQKQQSIAQAQAQATQAAAQAEIQKEQQLLEFMQAKEQFLSELRMKEAERNHQYKKELEELKGKYKMLEIILEGKVKVEQIDVTTEGNIINKLIEKLTGNDEQQNKNKPTNQNK